MVLFSCDANVVEFEKYDPLPEQLIAFDAINDVTASYVVPVAFYNHGVLGDAIEASGLLVEVGARQLTYLLDSTQVFEDIVPRLVDVDGDDYPEVICILSSIYLGARIAVFKIERKELVLLAQSEPIGRKYRWLNIAAITDLNKDGIVEVCWVTTPHIGGSLNVGNISGDYIPVIDRVEGVTNHQIRTGNLDLSLVYEIDGIKKLFIPNSTFDMVVGFQFNGEFIFPVDTVFMDVDPLVPLYEQFTP